MGKNQEYAQQYAEYAMEQMRRYGIPASVTLAQGILESSNGQSRLARNENNHFGIKATPSWIAGGGRYGTYTWNGVFVSGGTGGISIRHLAVRNTARPDGRHKAADAQGGGYPL